MFSGTGYLDMISNVKLSMVLKSHQQGSCQELATAFRFGNRNNNVNIDTYHVTRIIKDPRFLILNVSFPTCELVFVTCMM